MNSFKRKFRGLYVLIFAVCATVLPPVLLNEAYAADYSEQQVINIQEVAQTTADRSRLSKVFRQIIQDPGNIELNIRYAKLAEKIGVPRRALAAYERIQASHPNNARALQEIDRLRELLGLVARKRKKLTAYSIVLGARFETNAAKRETEYASYDSAASSAALKVRDDRSLFGTRVKTNATLLVDYYNRYTSGDLVYGVLETGPVFNVANSIQMRVAAGAGHARLDKDRLFSSGYVKLNFDDESDPKTIRTSNLSLGYEDYAGVFEGRDGLFFEAGSRIVQFDTVVAKDSLSVQAHYRYKNASGYNHSKRGHKISLQTGYLYPLYDKIFAGGDLGLTYRSFDGQELDENEMRWDFQIDPALKLVFTELPVKKSTIEVKYNFERNWSNVGYKTFYNHIIGAKVGWAF